MTPDPKRSPIAALAKKWRERINSLFASGVTASEDFYECTEQLEAAIAAQVEVFDRNEGVTCRAECIQLLKGPKP